MANIGLGSKKGLGKCSKVGEKVLKHVGNFEIEIVWQF